MKKVAVITALVVAIVAGTLYGQSATKTATFVPPGDFAVQAPTL